MKVLYLHIINVPILHRFDDPLYILLNILGGPPFDFLWGGGGGDFCSYFTQCRDNINI